MTKIAVLGVALSHDSISVIDTGNNFTVQLSGTGLVDGIQEFHVGTLACQEVGTSVGASLSAEKAKYRDIDDNGIQYIRMEEISRLNRYGITYPDWYKDTEKNEFI